MRQEQVGSCARPKRGTRPPDNLLRLYVRFAADDVVLRSARFFLTMPRPWGDTTRSDAEIPRAFAEDFRGKPWRGARRGRLTRRNCDRVIAFSHGLRSRESPRPGVSQPSP